MSRGVTLVGRRLDCTTWRNEFSGPDGGMQQESLWALFPSAPALSYDGLTWEPVTLNSSEPQLDSRPTDQEAANRTT